ncbi:Protein of unknown function [Gryllus bimaculatus]|nr:Protein of unknown function [Gryllus bimaculatus]
MSKWHPEAEERESGLVVVNVRRARPGASSPATAGAGRGRSLSRSTAWRSHLNRTLAHRRDVNKAGAWTVRHGRGTSSVSGRQTEEAGWPAEGGRRAVPEVKRAGLRKHGRCLTSSKGQAEAAGRSIPDVRRAGRAWSVVVFRRPGRGRRAVRPRRQKGRPRGHGRCLSPSEGQAEAGGRAGRAWSVAFRRAGRGRRAVRPRRGRFVPGVVCRRLQKGRPRQEGSPSPAHGQGQAEAGGWAATGADAERRAQAEEAAPAAASATQQLACRREGGPCGRAPSPPSTSRRRRSSHCSAPRTPATHKEKNTNQKNSL